MNNTKETKATSSRLLRHAVWK